MTAAPDPIWRAHDDNGRPVHNATMTVFASDGQIADTWLDARLSKRGCNPRFSNIRGEFCNSPADGTPAGLHLAPGEYIVVIARGDGRPLGTPIRITVKPEGGQVIEVRAQAAPAPQPGQGLTIVAAGSGQGDAQSQEVRMERMEKKLSHVSEAIRQLLEGNE